MSLLVVGSVAFDAVETPHGKVDRMLGGAATYFSVAASYFTHVNLVGIVGIDFTDKDESDQIDVREITCGNGKIVFRRACGPPCHAEFSAAVERNQSNNE